MKVKVEKSAIIKKLEEIGLAQQEDRCGPEDEMIRVVKREEKFEEEDVEYLKSIYTSDKLRNLEIEGSYMKIKPTKDLKAVEEK